MTPAPSRGSRSEPDPAQSGTVWSITTGRFDGHGSDRLYVLPTVDGPTIDGSIEVVPKIETQAIRDAAHQLARWTQHLDLCDRSVSTADACTCGLQEAWEAIDA